MASVPNECGRPGWAGQIRLRDMGAFHVGGETLRLEGKPLTQRLMAVGGEPVTLDPNGTYIAGQMYAQYFLPDPAARPAPLVFWHGGGLTGACWETTPDGRPGWLHYFLRRGWDAYLCDAVERGRSGFAPVPDVWPTPVSQTAEDVFKRFRIGTPAHGESLDSLADGAYPNGCFPVESFGALVRQLVPRWTHTDDVIFRGYLSLLDRADPCVLVCHSQGGMFGLRAAMVRPDRVKAVVALEPASVPPPEEWPADYRVPTLILLGDNIESDARWPAIRNKIAAFAARYPCVKLISLPSVGLSGNSHMLMMDKNSLEIADLAHDWLVGNLAGAESGKS